METDDPTSGRMSPPGRATPQTTTGHGGPPSRPASVLPNTRCHAISPQTGLPGQRCTMFCQPLRSIVGCLFRLEGGLS
jgi:hypothetical protein